VLSREVPGADGAPFVGIDLASGRAWSAAVAMWHSGRTEAIALAPGLPSLAEQAKRDRTPATAYQRLYDNGVLFVDEELRVQRPSELIDLVVARWGVPALVICDRFRISELLDAVDGICDVEPRVTRWSEASADIRAVRRMALDGPLAVEPQSDDLIGFSLSKAKVENDDSGNSRMVKQKRDNTGRDDVAMALTLAAGAIERYPEPEQVEHWGAIVV
jgi:phage terminase large subunit-like protein